MIAPLLAAAAVAAAPEPQVVHDETSGFGRIMVVDEGDLRHLRFGDIDAADQSSIARSDPRAVPMEYVRWASLGLAFVPRPRRSLVIGLGGGTFPMLLRQVQPAMEVTAVEIDPAVVRVARRWFGLREDRRLRVVVDDGAAFVARDRGSWDLILVDAYGHGAAGIPPALRSDEFLAAILRRLGRDGVAVLNVAIEDTAEENNFLASIARAFPACTLVRTPVSDNVVLFVGRRLIDDWPARIAALLHRPGWPFTLPDAADRFRDCATDVTARR